MTKQKQRTRARAYYDASRRVSASYVFIAPLFAIYQLGLSLDPRVRNGTDPIFRELFDRFRHLGMVAINLLLLGVLLLAIWRTRSRRIYVRGMYGFMFLEACAWTGLMLLTGGAIYSRLLALPPLAQGFFASAGAGIYEEVLFRLLLMGGIILVLHRALGGRAWWVVPLAVVVSALVFSWAHHGLGGEPFRRGVFWYRAGMGAVLGGIFWARGLGIVVYTHAFYNAALILMRHVGS